MMNSIHKRFRINRDDAYRKISNQTVMQAHELPKDEIFWKSVWYFDRILQGIVRELVR
jgi:hypothetical protein